MAIYDDSLKCAICNTPTELGQQATSHKIVHGRRSTDRESSIFSLGPRPRPRSLVSSWQFFGRVQRLLGLGVVEEERVGQRLTAIGDHGSLGKASNTWKTYLVPQYGLELVEGGVVVQW